jgi:hypothetical protein
MLGLKINEHDLEARRLGIFPGMVARHQMYKEASPRRIQLRLEM